MAIKKLFAVLAIGLAMGILSATATADSHGGMVQDYVTNPSGEVWKNSYGECWRDRFAATDVKLEECGYEKVMGVAEVVVKDDMKAVVVTDAPPACPDVIVLKNLHFKFDSATVSDEDKGKLDRAIEFVRAAVPQGCHKTQSVSVTGHTDSTGPEAYNETLSLKRANAVVDYMRSEGVKVDLVAAGKGESEPVADNSTKEGRAENRRVVIDVDTSN